MAPTAPLAAPTTTVSPDLRTGDRLQPGIGGEPRHAQHAQGGAQRRVFRVEARQPVGRQREPALPAAMPADKFACGDALRPAGQDLPDALTLHHLAEPDRRRVGGRIVHPAAHVGVERQPDRAHQDLARRKLRDGDLVELEVLRHRRALRSSRQQDFLVHVQGHRLARSACSSS